MRAPCCRALVLVLLLAFGGGANAEVPLSDEYLLRVWEVEEGLPQNVISGITQTADGYLWLATWNGLARFDGSRFTTFQAGTTPGLDSSYVRSVMAARDGTLWVGLDRGGVARMEAGRFESFIPPAPRTSKTSWVSSFTEDRDGAVWFGVAVERLAFRSFHEQLSRFTFKEGIALGGDTFVEADFSGQVWYYNKESCGILEGKRFKPVDVDGGKRPRLAAAREGGVWAVRGNRLLRYQADGSVEQIADLGWVGGSTEIYALFEDDAGDLWLGSRGAGLFRFRDGGFVRVPTSHKSILCIAQDRDRNLWVGTWGGGLNRLRPRKLFLRDSRNGLAKDGTVSICEDDSKALWIAMREGPPVRSPNGAHHQFDPIPGFPEVSVTVLCANPAGGIWIGCNGGGLLQFKDGVFAKAGLSEAIASLMVDSRGDLWVATMRGALIRWSNGAAYPEPVDKGLVVVRALAEDSAGNIWAGTEDGLLFRRERSGFVPVPVPASRAGDSIRFLVPDVGGMLWIGTSESGLLRWNDGRVTRLARGTGLLDDDLRAMVIDLSGDFWIGSGRGLFRTTRKDLEAVFSGDENTLRGVVYRRDDGLPNAGFVFGSRNAVARTGDGHLWFATDRGLLEIDPRSEKVVPVLPPVLLEELRVNGVAVPLAKSLRLEPKPGPLEFRFSAPLMTSPERLRFRCRLLGLDARWIEIQREPVASFPYLGPGSYRFEVQARTTESAWPQLTTSQAFEVRAAWWETKLFRATLILLGMAALAGLTLLVVRRRVRARIRALEQQNALSRERARIARDMHDDLGSSLTRISLMSEFASQEPEFGEAAGVRFGEIATAARSVCGALDEIVWTVNPRNDTLDRLVGYIGEFAHEYLDQTGMELDLKLPAEVPVMVVPSDTRHQVLLSVKEALNNVVKHAGAGAVSIEVVIAGLFLEITIRDSGRGFDPAGAAASSNGLINMQQRMRAVSGSCQIESRPGSGSQITFRVPLPLPVG